MTISRWNPFREMDDFVQRLGQMARRPTAVGRGTREAMPAGEWAPVVDIVETPGEYVIKAELPEVKRSDVNVSLHAGTLSIQGERQAEKEEEGTRFHRMERSYGTFNRSFSLPENVDGEGVRANLKDGVLSLCLPKSELAEPETIVVQID